MKKISLEMIRRDNVKVELDPEFFNEEWFEGFSEYFYDLDGLDELAEHITYNVQLRLLLHRPYRGEGVQRSHTRTAGVDVERRYRDA